MEFLFGEGQFGLRILLAVFLALALIGVLAWLVRRFRSERTGAASRRARQPRLAVIDAAVVDGRRRLVIIRRDNVEHLLMIGGRADIVVEPRRPAARRSSRGSVHPCGRAQFRRGGSTARRGTIAAPPPAEVRPDTVTRNPTGS